LRPLKWQRLASQFWSRTRLAGRGCWRSTDYPTGLSGMRRRCFSTQARATSWRTMPTDSEYPCHDSRWSLPDWTDRSRPRRTPSRMVGKPVQRIKMTLHDPGPIHGFPAGAVGEAMPEPAQQVNHDALTLFASPFFRGSPNSRFPPSAVVHTSLALRVQLGLACRHPSQTASQRDSYPMWSDPDGQSPVAVGFDRCSASSR
jgi:hypothetical protein